MEGRVLGKGSEMVRALVGVTSFTGMSADERDSLRKRLQKYAQVHPENCKIVEDHLDRLERAEARVADVTTS